MDTSIITNFFKKAAKNFAVGAAGAIQSGDNTKLVPAIAPIPIAEVDTLYGQAKHIQQDPNETEKEYEEVVVEAIKEIAQQRNLPYEKEPEVALEKGGIVKSETIAKVGEKEPEVVTPVKNYGESVELVYKQGAALIISSSLGFLKTLPPSPAKSSVVAEANKLKNFFGIAETPKPQKVIGLKAPLVWWGSAKQPDVEAPKVENKTQTPEKTGGGGGIGNPLRMVKNLKNLGKKFKLGKLVKKTKIGKGLRKVAGSSKKLVKGAKKASMALLKKGSKKIAAKVGGKAIAKVGAKALGKGLLKKIPFVGMGAGLLFAGQRLMAGDFKGAMLEAASGIASTIPGVGTAVSVGLDAALAAKDMGVLPGQKEAADQVGAAPSPNAEKDMYGRTIVLNPSTMKAWKKVVNAAAKDGINLPMSVTSSYRSPEQQQALVDAAAAGDPAAINPAPVGQSPHGQGWAVDIDYYSKANEWMRDKGSKFGFKWQGEGDPVHFDFYNNEPNDKWLRPGKNKWIPNVDPVTTKTKSSGNVKTATKSDLDYANREEAEMEYITQGMDPSAAAKQALADFPVTQGGGGIGAGGVMPPQIIPVPGNKQVIYVPETKKEESKSRTAVIDVFGKGSMEVVS